MKQLTLPQFSDFLKEAGIKTRLQGQLRFKPEEVKNWDETELLAVTDRSGNKGILLIELDEKLSIIPYELSSGITDSLTGRSRPITCDFCSTWQAGSNGASITFRLRSSHTVHTRAYLCCDDLRCSQHVRSKTKESLVSRTQLHENMTDQDRVARLQRKLRWLVESLGQESDEIPATSTP